MISVIVPTVAGRYEYLERFLNSLGPGDYQISIHRDLPGCGQAWAEGAEEAEGDYILFAADDLEMHPGWAQAASRVCDLGYLPAPRILNTDGSLQSCGDWGIEMRDGAIPEFTRVPFVSREQWQIIGPDISAFLKTAHYYTDNAFTWAGRKHGIETVVCRGFSLTHHFAQQGRKDDRMAEDGARFVQFINS